MPENTTYLRTTILYTILLFAVNILPTGLSGQITEAEDQYYFIEGLRQYNIGSLDEAQKIFLEQIGKGTKNDAVYYYLANIYLKKGGIKKAEEMMGSALKLDPENYWYSVQLAKIYREQDNLKEAIKIFEELRDKYPRKADLYEDMIDIYIEQKDFDKARKVIEDVEKYVGKSEATGLTRYNLLIYENKKDEAFRYLHEFDKEYSTPRTATLLGDFYSAQHVDSSARYYYDKALSLDPTYVPASFGLAELYRIKGQFDLYFARIYPFLANPDVDSRMKVSYMSEILSNQKFVATFIPQVDSMMYNLFNAHPTDSSVAYSYAIYLTQTNKIDKGVKILTDNLKVYPDSKEAHRQYLSLLYYTEDWDALIRNSDSALVIFPGDTAFLELKGVGLLQAQRIPESIDVFKQILKLTKNDNAATVRNLSVLGDLYYQTGKKKEAFNYYRKTLSKDPNHIPTLNNYAYFLSEEGSQLKKAYKMSKKTIEAEPDNATYLDTYAWILHLLKKDIEAKAILKHAMIYGGSENAAMLDHYAEILYSLKEYDLAFIYWGQADKMDPSIGIAAKVAKLKGAAK